jgi:hypothetical protein
MIKNIPHTVIQMLYCPVSARAVLPAAQEPKSAGEYVLYWFEYLLQGCSLWCQAEWLGPGR